VRLRRSQRRALAELNQVRLNLALDTAGAYLNAVLAEEQERLWRRYIFSLETLLQTITRRAELGASPPADIKTAKTRYSQATAGFTASNFNLFRNRLHLRSLTHYSTRGLAWPDANYRLTAYDSQKILSEKAIETHPIGQLAIAEIELQRAKVCLAKSWFFPQLNLQYNTDR
jgi:outer membrane protein TolC